MFVFWIRQLKVKSLQKNNFNLKSRLKLLLHDKQLREIHFSNWSIFWLLVEVIMELLDRFTKLFSFSSADSRRCWIGTGVLLMNLLQLLLLFRNFQVFRWNNWFKLWWWFFFQLVQIVNTILMMLGVVLVDGVNVLSLYSASDGTMTPEKWGRS